MIGRVSFSALTLSVGWQEEHPALKTCNTYSQMFSFGTSGGKTEVEPADPGLPGKPLL